MQKNDNWRLNHKCVNFTIERKLNMKFIAT